MPAFWEFLVICITVVLCLVSNLLPFPLLWECLLCSFLFLRPQRVTQVVCIWHRLASNVLVVWGCWWRSCSFLLYSSSAVLSPSGSIHAIGGQLRLLSVNAHMDAVHHQISSQQIQQQTSWTEVASGDSRLQSGSLDVWFILFFFSWLLHTSLLPYFVLCH